MNSSPQKADLVARIKKEVPEGAGVYLFRDRFDRIQYVGKSVNLRHRMSSYFSTGSREGEQRTARMIHGICDFSYQETGSELSALLLEDRLIKEHLPFYNTRQKAYNQYVYLHLSRDPFPVFKPIDDELPGLMDRFPPGMGGELPGPSGGAGESKGGRLFGPFRDRHFLDDLLKLVNGHFKLRTCPHPVPVQKCIRHEMGKCLGPCFHAVSEERYGQEVDRAVAFLEGDEGEMLTRMKQDMEMNAAGLDFEKAAEAKDRMAWCRRFCKRQRFIRRFLTGVLVVHEPGNREWTHLFIEGEGFLRAGKVEAQEIEGWIAEVRREGIAPGEDLRFLLDRAHIVHTWLQAGKGQRIHYFV